MTTATTTSGYGSTDEETTEEKSFLFKDWIIELLDMAIDLH